MKPPDRAQGPTTTAVRRPVRHPLGRPVGWSFAWRTRQLPAGGRRATVMRRRAGAVAVLTVIALTAFTLGLLRSRVGAGQSQPSPRANTSRGATTSRALTAAGVAVSAARVARSAAATPGLAQIDRILSYTSYIVAGSPRVADVALTFDDGPSRFTPSILAILRREHVHATFFQIGREVRANPRIASAVHRAGMVIGDHTETHPMLGRLSASAQAAQLDEAAAAIEAAGAPAPLLFRPPYGSFDATTLRLARERHMLMVLWSVDTRDFARPGVASIVRTALSGARAGAIILMHDGGGERSQTIAALPRIINGLRRRGFHLVTLTHLLSDDPPPRGQPPPPVL